MWRPRKAEPYDRRERTLRLGLMGYGGRVAVVSVPWQIEQATPAQGVAAEEGCAL